MNTFEKQLIQFNSSNTPTVDETQFLKDLHQRVDTSQKNKQSLSVAFVLVFTMFITTYMQIGIPLEEGNYFAEDFESNYFETDFWTISDSSLVDDSTYVDDLAYFLLEEGDLWDTMDLINEIEYENRSTL